MKNYNDIFGLKDDISRIVNSVYDQGYDKGYRVRQIEEEFDEEDSTKAIEEAYQNGLDDGWKCARKVRCMTFADRTEIFGTESVTDIFNCYSASEAVAKIKEYEEKQKAKEEKKTDDEIKVGDEVIVDERHMIVLGVDSGEWKQLWCPSNGLVYDNITTSEMTKTGRHFDIQNIFEQMRGSESNDN